MQHTNVGQIERELSMIAGLALGVYGLIKRGWGGAALGAAGAMLLHRGTTGHCALYQTLGIDRSKRGVGVPETITADELKEKLDAGELDNEHANRGFALVSVLRSEYFEAEHIVGSINIPAGRETEYETRFSTQKEIVVYDAALEGTASSIVAERLRKKGFSRLRDFQGGLKEWRDRYPTSTMLEH